MKRVGVDIGGTFTDLVAMDGDGRLVLGKCSTTPQDLARGVEDCLRMANLKVESLDLFLHGSTIAINSVLEAKGAKTALITTRGFRDVYEIGRGNRPEGYNLLFKRPVPLVPRELRVEVNERVNSRGEVMTSLDEADAALVVERLKGMGVESIAVCLLHSYANPVHEVRLHQIIGDIHPEAYVTLSYEVLREFREYERTSTSVLNAYVGPIVSRYISMLEGLLKSQSFKGNFLVMQSNGGAMSAERARIMPVMMMESGPVAGVIGAAHLGKSLGYPNLISFDMGGTTAKASLIREGRLTMAPGYFIGGYSRGYPMALPVVDIVEVGAGGGSIAWIDEAGALKVGPQSAGADPGPVCYGRGGAEPTVTDANLVLGRLDSEYFLGGEMKVDVAQARDALEARVAEPLGMEVLHLAQGILKIADAKMSLAVRAVTVERGYDPRDFAMIAFGGAGPLHALSIARELSIPVVIIPRAPGHFSALGMLVADLRHDFVQTHVRDFETLSEGEVEEIHRALLARGMETLSGEGVPEQRMTFLRAVDMRYQGQEYFITVPTSEGEEKGAIRKKFDELHNTKYGHCAPEEPVEVVNLRLTAVGKMEGRFPTCMAAGGRGRPQRREVYLESRFEECPVYMREALGVGAQLIGPAVIEEPASTTLLYPGDEALVSEQGHLIIRVALV